MNQQKKIPVKLTLCLLAAFVVLAVCCLAGRQYYSDSAPFVAEYVFDSPSGVFPGAKGRAYVVDYGKKRVLMVDERGEITRVLNGGADSDNQFFYASLVCEGADGSVYVADARYAHQGTKIRQERVFRFDENGQNPSLVYSIDYEGDDMPLQYGNILSMYEDGGKLIISVKTVEGLDVRVCNIETGEVTQTSYALSGQYLSDADVDPVTGRPVFVNRLGQVCAVDESRGVNMLVDDGGIAWKLCTGGGFVYYSELSSKRLMRLDLSTGETESIIQGEYAIMTAQLLGERVMATDFVGYYDWDGTQANYVDQLSFSAPILRGALWAALFLLVLVALALLYIVFVRPQIGRAKTATFQRMAIVLSVSACVSVLVTAITLGNMVDRQNESVMEQLNLCNDIMIQATDVDALKRIDSVSDYRNADYNAVKAPLDNIMDMTYENELYYYYVIYASDGQTINAVMDYENTVTAAHPTYDWGTEGYTDVLADAATVDVSADVSSYGTWSFVLKPIKDASGVPVAIMEVGINMDDFTAQNRSLLLETVFTVASMSIVLLMLIIEIIFYVEHRESRKESYQVSAGRRFPLRTLVFLTFMADCLQDPFVSILANKLYVPFWGIPQSLGAALPLSMQVITAALAALVCGSLLRRTGVKRMLSTGFVVQIAGFIICALIEDYFGLLFGKALIGVGMGAILVSLNAVSASGATEEEEAGAFTLVNAGTLAGISVGAGVGSIILSFADFSAVYYAGAAILLLGLLLAVTGADYKEPAARKEGVKLNFLRFLSDKAVWTFLLFMLTPFLIGISFREYLFPLYAEEAGISTTDIGRIYLLCGLFVIYAGPMLTRTLIGKLGSKWTVVLASVLISAATLLFAFYPTFEASLVSLLLLSMSISFGYAAQSTYYSGLPGVNAYGQGRAMGVYSLFDNGGQTLGPIIYGAAMLLGYRVGVFIIGGGLVALLLLFIATNVSKGKKVDVSRADVLQTDEALVNIAE